MESRTCRHCGQPVSLREIAVSGFTGEPVMRWCIAERIPGFGTYKCPANGNGEHEPH